MEPFFAHIFSTPKDGDKFKLTDYISDYHRQDCCEQVYVDFEQLDLHEENIKSMDKILWFSITKVEWEWILVRLLLPNGEPYKILLPCYNEQNWYYSSDLSLNVYIEEDDIEQVFDITDCH